MYRKTDGCSDPSPLGRGQHTASPEHSAVSGKKHAQQEYSLRDGKGFNITKFYNEFRKYYCHVGIIMYILLINSTGKLYKSFEISQN